MTIGRPYRRSRKKKNRNTAHAVEDLYTVVTAYTHLTGRRYVKNEMYRWILWGEHDDGKMAERLFGIKRHKHGNATEKE